MNPLRLSFTALLLAATVFAATPLAAHDFWLEPAAFEVQRDTPVALRLRVGEHFEGDAIMPAPSAIASFFARDLEGSRPVRTGPASQPIGLVVARQPGILALGYESRPSAITLDAGKFEQYLREEGLEHVIAARARRGESLEPGRELFARSAKALVRVDVDSAISPTPTPIGLPLELLPQVDPYTLVAGSSLAFDLHYQGQPLADVLVVAMPKADPTKARQARTDAAGRVSFDLVAAGPWLVKAVHMAAAPADSGADWASWWASLTFSIPGS